MVFTKHNSLKPGIFFDPIFIPFPRSMFLRVQVFQGPAFPGSGSKFQKQPSHRPFTVFNFTCTVFPKGCPENVPRKKTHPLRKSPLAKCPPGKLVPGKMPPQKNIYILLVFRCCLYIFKLFIVISFRGLSRKPATFIMDPLVTLINGIN